MTIKHILNLKHEFSTIGRLSNAKTSSGRVFIGWTFLGELHSSHCFCGVSCPNSVWSIVRSYVSDGTAMAVIVTLSFGVETRKVIHVCIAFVDMIKRLGKSADHYQYLIWIQSDYISMPNSSPQFVLRKMPRNRKFDFFHQVKLPPKWGKSREIKTKSNQFWRWSRSTNMLNFRSFLPCILKKMPGNINTFC